MMCCVDCWELMRAEGLHFSGFLCVLVCMVRGVLAVFGVWIKAGRISRAFRLLGSKYVAVHTFRLNYANGCIFGQRHNVDGWHNLGFDGNLARGRRSVAHDVICVNKGKCILRMFLLLASLPFSSLYFCLFCFTCFLGRLNLWVSHNPQPPVAMPFRYCNKMSPSDTKWRLAVACHGKIRLAGFLIVIWEEHPNYPHTSRNKPDTRVPYRMF